MNIEGEDFVEVSGVSGLDHAGDSRAFATMDFDRDGWLDIAMVNANAPRFQLFENRLSDASDVGRGQVLGVRFEGGNRSSAASSEWGVRDGYGAKVTVRVGDRTLVREHRAGEGFAAQNSATVLVGLDDRDGAESFEVRWPSGQVWDTTAVPAGTLVVAYENPAHSPTGAAFTFEPYGRSSSSRPLVASAGSASERVTIAHEALGGTRARLVMYTTMATWCAPCLEELPDMARLRQTFSAEELEIIGIPYDDEEDAATIASWSETNGPAYGILGDLPVAVRGRVRDLLLDELKLEGLPAMFITDSEGQILLTGWGPPSVSVVAKLLSEQATDTDGN